MGLVNLAVAMATAKFVYSLLDYKYQDKRVGCFARYKPAFKKTEGAH